METHPPRGALALCTIPSQSAIGQWGWGFHTVRGGFDPAHLRFFPQVVWIVETWKDFLSGDETLSSLGAAGPRHWQEGQRSSLASSMSLGQSSTSQPASGDGVSTPCEAVSTWEIFVFAPRLLELYMYEANFYRGMRSCPP